MPAKEAMELRARIRQLRSSSNIRDVITGILMDMDLGFEGFHEKFAFQKTDAILEVLMERGIDPFKGE